MLPERKEEKQNKTRNNFRIIQEKYNDIIW